MNLPKIAILLVVALAGCGKADPTKPDEPKPGDKKDFTPPTPTTTNTQVGGGTPTPPAPLGPTLLEPTDPVQQLAEKFVADLGKATDMAELLKRLTPAFLKIIGKPFLTDTDKAAGSSADAASGWLRRAGAQLTGIGPPTGYGSPTTAVFVGTFGNGTGRFLIRMVFAEGWKVDWFSLGTIAAPKQSPTTTEGSYQDFVVLAFLDALTGNATPKEDRLSVLAAVIAPRLREAWASPFAQDKDQGRDYNPGLLSQKAPQFDGGVTGFSRTPDAGDTFKIELIKGDVKTAYTLKLVKGTNPGEWLVEEFTKQ